MDVFDFALNMEKDAKQLYEKLAGKTTHPGLKKIFTDLAADEQKHYEIFLILREEKAAFMADSKALEGAKNIFEGMLREKEALPSIEGDLEGYRYAMSIEAKSFRFYEEAAEREQSENVRSLLLRIAEEERKHFSIVQNVYDFVNAPNQYLAWREFSNIEEFRQFGRDID